MSNESVSKGVNISTEDVDSNVHQCLPSVLFLGPEMNVGPTSDVAPYSQVLQDQWGFGWR